MTIDSHNERHAIHQGKLLLEAGLSPAQLKQQWLESGVNETRANRMLAAIDSQQKSAARKRVRRRRNSQRTATRLVGVLAVLVLGFGAFVVVDTVRGPTVQEQAREIARNACGVNEARLARIDGEHYVLGGEAMDVRISTDKSDPEFEQLFLGDGGPPSRAICSQVSLSVIKTCEGYSEQSPYSEYVPSLGASIEVQGSIIEVTMVDVVTNTVIDSARIALDAPECPRVFRAEFGETPRQVRRPNGTHGIRAIRALLNQMDS